MKGALSERRWRLALAGVGAFSLSLAFAQPDARSRREITLSSQPVPLSSDDASLKQVGGLTFLSGLSLQSPDEDFGGFSGLIVEPRGGELRMIAVTDKGRRFGGRLLREGNRLTGIDQATLEPLMNLDGAPVMGKAFGDAESLARLPDGRILVGFERRHRIWAYGPELRGRASTLEVPAALAKAPSNGGPESLASWPDGRILAITEQMPTAVSNRVAFLFMNGAWGDLEWRPSAPGFEPSDATVSPNGDLLVLERLWSAIAPTDLRSRVIMVKGDAVKTGTVLQGELLAELSAPLVTENFEGISAFRNPSGAVQLFLVSDDNFNGIQRTLLLWFEIQSPAGLQKP